MAACLVVENEAILRISRMMLRKSDHRFLTVQRHHAGPPGLPNMAEIPQTSYFWLSVHKQLQLRIVQGYLLHVILVRTRQGVAE